MRSIICTCWTTSCLQHLGWGCTTSASGSMQDGFHGTWSVQYCFGYCHHLISNFVTYFFSYDRLHAAGLLPLCCIVDPMCWGSLCFPVDRALLSALVDHWRPEIQSFHLPMGGWHRHCRTPPCLLSCISRDACRSSYDPSWLEEVVVGVVLGCAPADARSTDRVYQQAWPYGGLAASVLGGALDRWCSGLESSEAPWGVPIVAFWFGDVH